MSSAPARPVRLGLRENLAQFSLLVGVNALVGAMIGQERTVLPLIGVRVFHLHAVTAALTYILAFGVMKALTNFVAGTLSDRIGRKPVLVTGWLMGSRFRSCWPSARAGAGDERLLSGSPCEPPRGDSTSKGGMLVGCPHHTRWRHRPAWSALQ